MRIARTSLCSEHLTRSWRPACCSISTVRCSAPVIRSKGRSRFSSSGGDAPPPISSLILDENRKAVTNAPSGVILRLGSSITWTVSRTGLGKRALATPEGGASLPHEKTADRQEATADAQYPHSDRLCARKANADHRGEGQPHAAGATAAGHQLAPHDPCNHGSDDKPNRGDGRAGAGRVDCCRGNADQETKRGQDNNE